ncbi:NAD(P)H-binding protein [Micromonospora sp. PLK6-60]|uniref:NAD(P)H-binding protein n=1 Tax=Micromonospora sp. PLK6-60 TaxID=2873383 RepID=UPI001CA607B1|nr:NAD(P)H-binding protein [Micromonospora sp. PLK6-60]MBY8872450.1 NAD(P)H-binding protein [Micromonospora sp. PLK6-60]
MILVTGATGTIGGEVVQLLTGRGEPVRAMTRNPARATLPAGVEVVRGDFDDPESLAKAATGVEALFLLDAPGPWIAQHDRAMLAAARAAGVRRVVKLSAIGTGEQAAKVGDWHLPGEQELGSSDAEWTVLRPSSFASNALRWAPAIRAGQPIPNPNGTGMQGIVDPRDVAEVAVRTLLSEEHVGQVLTLTGPELLSVPELAVRLGEVLGRTVATVDVSLDAYRERMLAGGLDPVFVEIAVNGAKLVEEGGNAQLTDEVAQVLGRPPRTFAVWAYDHRDAFAG